VRARLRELAAIRRRFGYRRLHILLAREGIAMNHKKLCRLYREERLQVRRRCILGALSLAKIDGARLPRPLCGLTVL
jgi:hypothetical protein